MFIGFFVFWILLGIGSTAFYYTAPYETKKLWHPFLTIGSGALFLAFIEFATNGELPVFFVLFLALITFLNVRNTRFCPKCNKTLYGRWSRDKFCPKCGADLDAKNHDNNQPVG
jgi:ribosomal protein S27AE